MSHENLHVSWNPYMILLSNGISFVGSYAAVSLCEQFRLCRTNPYRDFKNMVNPNIILILVAISIGGVAVWCMHFIGMSAIILTSPSGDEVRMGYDIGLTVASIFVVTVCAYLGLLIASNDRAFTKTKEQILNMVVDDARRSGVRVSSKFAIVALASLNKPYFLSAGGIVTAAGVCAMHYIGMVSQRFDGYMEWEPGVIAASVAIAVVVSIVAFWILFRLLALYPYMEWLRVASAMVMGLAVNAMHYTGMYGATFYYDPGRALRHKSNSVISESLAFSMALVLGSVVAWVLIIVAIRDMRSWHRYCSQIIFMTDEIFAKGARSRGTPVGQFLDRYEDVRGISFCFNPNPSRGVSGDSYVVISRGDRDRDVNGNNQRRASHRWGLFRRVGVQSSSFDALRQGSAMDQQSGMDPQMPLRRICKKNEDKIPTRAPRRSNRIISASFLSSVARNGNGNGNGNGEEKSGRSRRSVREIIEVQIQQHTNNNNNNNNYSSSSQRYLVESNSGRNQSLRNYLESTRSQRNVFDPIDEKSSSRNSRRSILEEKSGRSRAAWEEKSGRSRAAWEEKSSRSRRSILEEKSARSVRRSLNTPPDVEEKSYREDQDQIQLEAAGGYDIDVEEGYGEGFELVEVESRQFTYDGLLDVPPPLPSRMD